jgi:hypothetical protein
MSMISLTKSENELDLTTDWITILGVRNTRIEERNKNKMIYKDCIHKV